MRAAAKNQSPLNPQQEEAVCHGTGPLLISAGAGSGKTRTLTQRLIKLINDGVSPGKIVAITFTNKAADEIKERIKSQINPVRDKTPFGSFPFLGTFHSFGANILRSEGQFVERTKNFVIFDNGDSLRVVKKVLASLDVSDDRYPAPKMQKKISFAKDELTNPDLLEEPIKMVFEEYEKRLKSQNAFDFDDLIEKPVRIFQKYRDVLEKYQNKFEYLLVDEFQDINTSQYALVKLLANKHRNLNVVGDDNQCVLPTTKISTSKGYKMIKDLSLKNTVIAASGNGDTYETGISKIKKTKYNGNIIKITTNKGNILKLTPNHIIFTRFQLKENIYFVYLMYRKDKGFRVGLTKGARKAKNRELEIGVNVRSNQEKADKMWVLKVCSTREEAEYYEYYYAFKYGIPTVVFHTNGRSTKLNQELINNLYESIDTKNRVQKLMHDELLYFSYPHFIPQGTIHHSAKRLRIRVALFDDRRKSLIHPWGMSRIGVNTKDKKLKKEIERLGFKTREGKLSDWRFEIASLNHEKIEKIANELNRVKSEVEFVRNANLTKNKRLSFQPASHVRPSMLIAVKERDKVKEDVVKSVEVEQYKGFVYDLDVKNVHNYVANGLVVHNSIYGFRGADFRNFLNFEKDWKDAKIVNLGENYRSSQNIVMAAAEVIKNNKLQRPKELWTSNEEGELIKVLASEDAEEESRQIVSDILEMDESLGTAILYRTNAQSRALEQTLNFSSITYEIFGGLKFYERKEIRDIMAGLRYGFNPKDEISLERLSKTFKKATYQSLKEGLLKSAAEFKPIELIGFFLKTTNYDSYLKNKFDNSEERMENVKELITFAGTFNTLSEFIERVSLLEATDKIKLASAAPAIRLTTIHLAKGLEFDNVFVAGVNEGILPHQKSLISNTHLEEERRLMYVAMTRARKKLTLSFYGPASRFLYEIPPELIDFEGVKNWKDEDEIYLI